MLQIRMFVVVHECCKKLRKADKVPLLVWTDPPDATVTVTDQDASITGQPQFDESYGVFTHLIWLEGLTGKKTYHLTVTAQKAGYNQATGTPGLDRDPPDARKPFGTPPTITYPSPDQSVQSSFPVWGSAPTVGQCPCTAWLVDDSEQTYPGSPIPGQTPPQFGFSFQNIPGGSGAGLHYTLYVQESDGTQQPEDIYVQSLI